MPLYEFRCHDCGVFDLWRSLAESSDPAQCPTCNQTASRIFSPPMLLSGSLRLKTESREPQLVKRDREPEQPKLKSCNDGRPWMVTH